MNFINILTTPNIGMGIFLTLVLGLLALMVLSILLGVVVSFLRINYKDQITIVAVVALLFFLGLVTRLVFKLY